MKQLAILLRSAQLAAQNAHNGMKGETFAPDHALAGDAYGQLTEAYDSVVERGIGLGVLDETDLEEIQEEAVSAMSKLPADNDGKLRAIAANDRDICERIEELCKSGKLTEGTRDLLAGIANACEHRMGYLISRRLKSDETEEE